VPRLTTFQNDGLTFDATDAGPEDGELVVLLHGYPENKESWAAITPQLTGAGYRVLAPDQRGYSPGARPKSRRAYTLPKLVGDVLAMVDAAGAGAGGRFHVVGHDWGGAVAWALAAAHPDRLASVTSLTTPHPSAMARSMVTSTQLLRSWYMLFYQLPALPELTATTAAGARTTKRTLVRSGLSEERADVYLELLRSGAARPAINWYRAIPFAGRAAAAAGKIRVPTLYVYAGADFALGRAAADATGRYVEGEYRYEVVEGASHWLPEQSPDVVGPMILEHLRAHPAG
jgi:pimeloyl-ACP methyl ester carboxylesterase